MTSVHPLNLKSIGVYSESKHEKNMSAQVKEQQISNFFYQQRNMFCKIHKSWLPMTLECWQQEKVVML